MGSEMCIRDSDPIFEVNGKTLAEMTLEEKSEISHRKNATIKMVELLNEK